jgi:hypothetical protein
MYPVDSSAPTPEVAAGVLMGKMGRPSPTAKCVTFSRSFEWCRVIANFVLA